MAPDRMFWVPPLTVVAVIEAPEKNVLNNRR